MQYNYAATCLFGLEGMVGGELDALGIQRTKTIDGRVYFKGSPADAANPSDSNPGSSGNSRCGRKPGCSGNSRC